MTVRGTEKIDFAIAGLVSKISDWTALWPQVTDLIESRIQRPQFASRGARGSGIWAGYKHTYSSGKTEGEPASLRETDRLYDSLVGRTGDTIEEYEPLKMRFGSSVEYATFHQTGTRKMAARPIFDFQPEDNRQIASMLTATARNYARKLGFGTPGGERGMTGVQALARGAGLLNEGASLSDYL